MGSSQSTSLAEGVELDAPLYHRYKNYNENQNSTYYRGVIKNLLTKNRKRYEHNHNLILDQVSRRIAEVGLKSLQFWPSGY